jgi:nucleotide-binding universal stress UspA family protein
MFKTILVPLDGSKRAERILPYVEDLAFARDAKVIFLQVIEPDVYVAAANAATPYYSQEIVESVFEGARAYLDTMTDEFRTKGLNATSLVKEGAAVHTILEVAEHEKADLIAMASHGRTGLARVFYGSVAAGILHQADRPLLLIRSDDPH